MAGEMKNKELIHPEKLKQANRTALKGIVSILPILFGILLLISIITKLIPESSYRYLFTGNYFVDSFIGSSLGSIMAGNPVTAYILGNGFLKNGVSLVAVVAFITSWTTVGIVQLPAEAIALGKKFAIFRNITAFFMSVIVAIVSVIIFRWI